VLGSDGVAKLRLQNAPLGSESESNYDPTLDEEGHNLPLGITPGISSHARVRIRRPIRPTPPYFRVGERLALSSCSRSLILVARKACRRLKEAAGFRAHSRARANNTVPADEVGMVPCADRKFSMGHRLLTVFPFIDSCESDRK
jgi:hypothetical protein